MYESDIMSSSEEEDSDVAYEYDSIYVWWHN